ncbi:hypothetical protein HaLaN_10067, partial [Haematococcus lacustris]
VLNSWGSGDWEMVLGSDEEDEGRTTPPLMASPPDTKLEGAGSGLATSCVKAGVGEHGEVLDQSAETLHYICPLSDTLQPLAKLGSDCLTLPLTGLTLGSQPQQPPAHAPLACGPRPWPHCTQPGSGHDPAALLLLRGYDPGQQVAAAPVQPPLP